VDVASSIALIALLLAFHASAQTITKLPMPQSFHTDELRIQWETDSDPAGTNESLEWGLASPAEHSVAAQPALALAAGHFLHRAVATGLTPETTYQYRVRAGTLTSPTYSVRTAPLPDTPFRIACIADNQNQAGAPFATVLAPLATHAPDAIVHAGDTVQDGDVFDEWQSQWFDPLAAAPGGLGQHIPVLVARGNHDGEFAQSLAYHWLPGNGDWYAETIGRTRFLFLNTNVIDATHEDFIRTELASPASRDADFRIAVFHKPPFTNLWDGPDYLGEPYVRGTLVPLLEQGGVDLVISGHAHAYERGAHNGITYVIVGGAGGKLDTVPQSPPWPFITVAQSVHHFGILEVSGRHLQWTAYDRDDHPIDSLALTSVTGIAVFPGLEEAR